VSTWEAYDPTWLVELAREQVPEEPWLPDALSTCRRAWRRSAACTYFVDPTNPNKPGSDWQFDANIVVEHPTEGTLVLDVLKDQRIGGFETLDRIEE
jgi:hypothetical protein